MFDPVGGSAFADALKCVRWGAHILVIGFAGGVPKIPVCCLPRCCRHSVWSVCYRMALWRATSIKLV